MAELNDLLDAAAQQAEALSAQTREARAVLTELRNVDTPAIVRRVDEAAAASRDRLAAMTEQLGHWEDELDAAGTRLDGARTALQHGADTTRADAEDFLARATAGVDDLVDMHIPKAQQEMLEGVQARLAEMDQTLEQLRAHDRELDEKDHQQREVTLPSFEAAVQAASHKVADARDHHQVTLESITDGVREAKDRLVAALADAMRDVANRIGATSDTLSETLEHTGGEVRQRLLGDGIDKLRSAEDETATTLEGLQLKVQVEMQRYSHLYETLSNILKASHDAQMTAINNLR